MAFFHFAEVATAILYYAHTYGHYFLIFGFDTLAKWSLSARYKNMLKCHRIASFVATHNRSVSTMRARSSSFIIAYYIKGAMGSSSLRKLFYAGQF